MPDETRDQRDETKGAMKGDRGNARAQSSGPRGDNPATAGSGETKVDSSTPEKASQQIDPSAPGETGTTPGSNAK